MLLCWFALFLAVRHTADERRPDIGLLKLRGAAPWRIWSLTAQQSALPMLTGAVVGWVLGYAAAAALAGGGAEADRGRAAVCPLWSVVVVCLGAFVAAVGAEWTHAARAGGRPAAAGAGPDPPGWRPDLVDLTVVALAVAGVYQGHAERPAASRRSSRCSPRAWSGWPSRC